MQKYDVLKDGLFLQRVYPKCLQDIPLGQLTEFIPVFFFARESGWVEKIALLDLFDGGCCPLFGGV